MIAETRIMKESASIKALKKFDKIYLVGYLDDQLPELENLDSDRTIVRFGIKGSITRIRHIDKILRTFKFMVAAYRRFKGEHVGVVQVHNLATLPLGVAMKWAQKSKLVYDAHELETERSGWPGYLRLASKVVERILMPFVDEVLVVGQSIAEFYGEKYPYRSIPTVIYNAPHLQSPVKSDYFREKFQISPNTKIFIYQGLISNNRGIQEMIDAFSKPDLDIAIVFLGFGDGVPLVRAAAQHSNAIYYHPTVDYDQLLNTTASADYGITFLLTGSDCLSYQYAMPNKLFEYSFSEIPFISTYGKDMKRLVDQFGIGVVHDPKKGALRDAIQKIMSEDYEQMTLNLKRFKIEYCWERQEERLQQLYRTLCP